MANLQIHYVLWVFTRRSGGQHVAKDAFEITKSTPTSRTRLNLVQYQDKAQWWLRMMIHGVPKGQGSNEVDRWMST